MSTKASYPSSDDDRVPSYEESVSSLPPLILEQKTTSRTSLQQHLSATRSRRISETITKYIEPLLLSHGLDGVLKRVFILIPSDILPECNLSERNVVCAQSGAVTLIRLEGQEHQASFWQQPAVITEFTDSLRTRFVRDTQESNRPLESPQTKLPARPVNKFWPKKKSSLPDNNYDPTGSTGQWKIGWRSDEDGAARQKALVNGQLDIQARLRDTSLRTENEYGLLATETVKCVWLEVEIGI